MYSNYSCRSLGLFHQVLQNKIHNQCFSSLKGLLPICLHVDGAEFYSNTEFVVWSMQSVFTSGNAIWDCKFPLALIPHEMMRDNDIKESVQTKIATVVAWSLKASSSGIWPSVGPLGEPLVGGDRVTYQGKPLAGDFRGCYFAFRADGKGRKETNLLPRSYMHNLVCDLCLAQKEHKGWNPLMDYKNFHETAAYRLTPISP